MTKFQRKIVALLITIVMILSTVSMAFAGIDTNTTYQQSANQLKEYGVFVGDGQGNLMLDQTLKRQDAVLISLRLMGITDEESENYENLSDFTDIANPYYSPIIGMAQDMGLVEGMGDGTFGFDQMITAQQLETLLLRSLGYEVTEEVYANVDQLAEEVGIMSEISIDKQENITRDMVAQMMLNTLNTNVKDEDQKLGEKLGFFNNENPNAVAPVLSDIAASATTTSADTVTITGKVAPVTATVTVAGNAATVAADGTFSAVVTLDKAAEGGVNNIAVAATNDGKSDNKTVAVTYVAQAPIAVKAVNAVGESVDLASATNMVEDKDNLFTITFPETINKDSVTRTYIKLYEGTGLVSLAAPVVKADNKTVTIGPSDNLKSNTAYKLVILKGIKKADGTTDVSAIDQEYSFTTGTANYIDALSDGLNQNTTVNVAAVAYGDDFQLTFKRDIDPSTINAASMKLYDITGGTNTQVPIVNKLGASNKILRSDIAATDGLLTGHQYKLVLGSLKDLLGANVALQEVSFTVGATNVGIDIFDADRATALASSSKVWPKLQAGSLDGTTAIKYGAKVYLRFSQTQAMDESTINTNTLYLEKLDKNGVIVGKVDATVAYDASFRMASITPAADLASDTQYKLTIKKGNNGIKDILGLKVDNSDTDETLTFRTLDVDAPAVASVALKTASGSDATVTSGLIDVDSTKQLRFAFNFNEEVASVDNDGTYAHGEYDSNLTDNDGASATSVKYLEAGKSIIVMNTTDDVSIDPAGLTISMSSDYKTIYVTAAAGTFEKAHSYAVKLAGKSNNPASSTTTAHAISDRTNFQDTGVDAADDAMGVNRMAEMYQFSFSTADSDSVAPAVTGVKLGTTYDSAVGPVPSGIKNIAAAATNIYILFSEEMGNATTKTTMDTDLATLQGTNVQIQSKAVGGSWAAETPNQIGGTYNALQNGANADYIMFTTDATKEISYLTIPATSLDADKNYRIVLTPGATANGIEDLEGNDLASDYIFELTTTGGLVFTPVAAGTSTTANIGTLAAAAAAGTSTISVTGADAFTSAIGEWVGIETVDGAFVFDTVATLDSAEPATITGTLTAAVASGAMIVDFTNASSSFADMGTNYGIKDPIGIKISGVASNMVDLNTISSATVKLIKTSDGSEVAAAVTAVRGDTGDALVSINPTADLAVNTQYKVHVEGVKDEVGNSIGVKDAFFTTAKGDAAKIVVTAVSPTASGAAAVNAPITVTFNEDMTLGTGAILAESGSALVKGATTAAGTNALATASTAGTAKIGLRTAAGVYLTGRLALSADGKVLTIIPDALLVANTTYVIELGSSLTTNDNSGAGGADVTLGARNTTDPANFPLSYNFRTEETASVDPAIASAVYFDADNNGVDVGDSLVITFNTAMTVANIPAGAGNKDTYFTIDLGGDLGDATASAAWSSDAKTVTITLGASPVIIPNASKITVASGATVTSKNGVQASSTALVTITK